MHRTLVASALVAVLGFTAPSSLLDRLWLLFSSVWSDSASPDAGCIFDPNGGCAPDVGAQSDIGCGWDPNGGDSCLQNTQARLGCTFDPSGRCIPNQKVEAKVGCTFDPYGRCTPAP